MPRSKDADSYSREYGEAIQRAFLQGEVVVETPTWALAKRIQSEFYAYILAVKRQPDRFVEMAQACQQVSVTITKKGEQIVGPFKVRLYNKENSVSATLLRAALGTKKQSEEAEESLAKLFVKHPTTLQTTMDKPFNYEKTPEVSEKVREKVNKYLGATKRPQS